MDYIKYKAERRFPNAWFILCQFWILPPELKDPMPSPQVPDELLILREQIDRIDDELVELLATRFAVTAKVGELKARDGLDSVDPVREQEKLERLKKLAAQKGLNAEFTLDLFQTVFDEVVKNHRNYLK
jgi:chorismate mutase